MSPLFWPTVLLILCFGLIWWSAGISVASVTKFARDLHLPQFTVSFFLLGMLTSLPEIAIGIFAIIDNTPAVFVGNLLGGSLMLFLLVIPLLALAGNGVRLPRQLSRQQLWAALAVVVAPTLILADEIITMNEAALAVILYIPLWFIFSFRKSLRSQFLSALRGDERRSILFELGSLVGSLIILFVASRYALHNLLEISRALHIPPFLMGLFVVSFGTNLPEMSIIVRSLLGKQPEVALADYLGSASANTFLLGVLTLIHGRAIVLGSAHWQHLVVLLVGVGLFAIFARTDNRLGKREAFALIALFCVLVLFEAAAARIR